MAALLAILKVERTALELSKELQKACEKAESKCLAELRLMVWSKGMAG